MKWAFTIAVVCFTVIAKAQLYDAQWALGDSESVVDFRLPDTVKTYAIPAFQHFFLTNASICDSAGNLLFYTNGISICGINGPILNGDNISPCAFTTSWACCGLDIPQAALFIPKPGSDRYYYLFHFSDDDSVTGRPATLYYSEIDREANNGQGGVLAKNQAILTHKVLHDGGMTACKHANGRDYWLVIGESTSNTYYKFLITSGGVNGAITQSIGPVIPATDDVAYSKFSLDGSKYATGFYTGPTIVMDFDRCSGEFSDLDTIYNNASNDPISYPIEGAGSVEFSPNGRFLYIDQPYVLNQFDLQANNIQDSVVVYVADSTDPYRTHMFQLAPNGKIYGSTWNGGLYAYHVINHPDLKGDSCGFVYGGQRVLTDNSYNVPNLINYRLGPLIGSGCDTLQTGIGIVNTADKLIRIQPNPADKYVYVEIGRQGNYEFELFNTNGQLIDRRETQQVDYFDTEHLPAGIYFLSVKDKTTNTEIATKKVVVVH